MSIPNDEMSIGDLPGLSTACKGVLHARGINNTGQLRTALGGKWRILGIGPKFMGQIANALNGESGEIMEMTPAQLRALATISEVTKHPASRWRPVHTPPDMTWVDYVDATGRIGQCCRDGDKWRQKPTGEDVVFLLYVAPPVRR